MKTIEELQGFYQATLLPELKTLEIQRQRISQNLMIALLCVGGAILAVFGIATVGGLGPGALPVVFVAGFIGLAVTAIIWSVLTKGYVRQFKERVIGRIVQFIDPQLGYRPEIGINQQTYMASQIFTHRPDRYKAEDLVFGKLGATELMFSEVHSEYKTTHTDSKGHTHTEWHTIFKGILFVGDFNKHFAGATFVLPDTAEGLFGRFGQKLQSWNPSRPDLVRMEDPEFEKLFVVYGTDQIEARYILSPSLMQRITEFKQKAGRRIYLSFVASKVFVAVECQRNLFEPKVFTTLLDFGIVAQYFGDMQLALGIVEDLNLNTRIWTKQ